VSGDRADNLPVVAVLSAPGEEADYGFDALASEALIHPARSPETLATALREAQVLVVTDFRTRWLREAWPTAQRLEWVHATSAGIDAICFPELLASAIPLTNARGLFDGAIAEYVIGVVLAFAKDLPGNLTLQRKQHWLRRDSERIEGKRMLVVGAGGIGRRIARLARAAGMRTVGIAGAARAADADFEAVHAADALHAQLPQADYVVIAAPLTPSTRGLFGADCFRRMKRSARLINVGRGPIVQTDALVEALQQGAIAGAGLDVFETEPLPEGHPLWAMPNVLISPHQAGDFIGWRRALGEQFVDNFHRWRAGAPLLNEVDKHRYG
jgi:phosphoglycerate dehydrogenase-like enzyme